MPVSKEAAVKVAFLCHAIGRPEAQSAFQRTTGDDLLRASLFFLPYHVGNATRQLCAAQCAQQVDTALGPALLPHPHTSHITIGISFGVTSTEDDVMGWAWVL